MLMNDEIVLQIASSPLSASLGVIVSGPLVYVESSIKRKKGNRPKELYVQEPKQASFLVALVAIRLGCRYQSSPFFFYFLLACKYHQSQDGLASH